MASENIKEFISVKTWYRDDEQISQDKSDIGK